MEWTPDRTRDLQRETEPDDEDEDEPETCRHGMPADQSCDKCDEKDA